MRIVIAARLILELSSVHDHIELLLRLQLLLLLRLGMVSLRQPMHLDLVPPPFFLTQRRFRLRLHDFHLLAVSSEDVVSFRAVVRVFLGRRVDLGGPVSATRLRLLSLQLGAAPLVV